MTNPALRFDPDDLRDYAGGTTFDRGLAYFRKGAVRITRIDARGVVAVVTGTEDYRVRLSGSGRQLGGDCTCPAYEDSGFCKHMVATALAANAAGDAGGTDDLAAIRAYLEAQPKPALVALLVEQAEEDPDLLRRLEVAAAADADPRAAEAMLRKALDDATRTRRLPEYRNIGAWAAQIAETLDAIERLARGPAAAVALTLADHALARIGAALGTIDDSDGHGGNLLLQAAEMHHVACQTVRPDPVTLARDLFAREVADDYGCFRGAARTYAEVLGTAGRAEYRRLAMAAWDKIPARKSRDRRREEPADALALFSILDGFAREEGDVAAGIALRAKDLSSPWAYVQLAAFCREVGRPAEALARAEEGLWVFEDERPDVRLLALASELLVEAGRPADAAAHLWRAFAAAPGLDLYQRLCAVGGDAARDRAIAALAASLPTAGRASPSADILLAILIRERRFDHAWSLAEAHSVGDALVGTLAGATEASHPRQALAAYAERVRRLVQIGGAPAYGEAVTLVARMARLQPPDEHAAFVAGLRERFARKRTFIQRLDEAERRADAAAPARRKPARSW